MKTKILSLAAAAAIALTALGTTGTAQARGGKLGLGHDYSYYKNGVSEYQYRKICERLHYNWKVLGNPRARELFLRWNCFKFIRIHHVHPKHY